MTRQRRCSALGCTLWAALALGTAAMAEEWQLTTDPNEQAFPSWSPDGNWILYDHYVDGDAARDIWRSPASGGDPEPLIEHEADDFWAEYSPDGTRVAFTSTRNGSWDIWVMWLLDGTLEQITDHPMNEHMPFWSPGSDSLGFTSNVNGAWETYKVPAVPLGPWTQVTDTGYASGGSWHDGWIAYYTMDIWKCPANGEPPIIQLTDTPNDDLLPRFSPDGEWILFFSFRDDEYHQIMMIPSDGGVEEQQTFLDSNYQPSWSPDGCYFAHTKWDGSQDDIWVRSVVWPPPATLSPGDGATCVSSSTELNWESVHDAAVYRIQAGTTCEGADILDVTTDQLSTTVDGLDVATTYYWRTRTQTECGEWGQWSSCRTFSTSPINLAAPIAYEPVGGEETPAVVTFRWSRIPLAEEYELNIAGVCYETPDETHTISDTTITLDLSGYEDFVWWVCGLGCGVRGEDSECEAVTPVLLESLRATNADDGVLLEWRTSDERNVIGFNVYREQVGPGGEPQRVNRSLIPSGERVYRLLDQDVVGETEYRYRLTELTTDDREVGLGEVTIVARVHSAGFTLKQNTPNPFNPMTTIGIRIDKPVRNPRVVIFDVGGRRVRTIAVGDQAATMFEVTWDGLDDDGHMLPSGAYFYRLVHDDGISDARRAVILK